FPAPVLPARVLDRHDVQAVGQRLGQREVEGCGTARVRQTDQPHGAVRRRVELSDPRAGHCWFSHSNAFPFPVGTACEAAGKYVRTTVRRMLTTLFGRAVPLFARPQVSTANDLRTEGGDRRAGSSPRTGK